MAFDKRGITDFQLLQNAFRDPQGKQAVYIVFDLLYLDGVDLRNRRSIERKAELARLKLPTDRGPLRLSEFVIGNGPAFFARKPNGGTRRHRQQTPRGSPYRAGRSTDWLKIKCLERSEFVIGGFTDPKVRGKGFGSLLLGVFDDHHRLTYAGRVGTGFSQRVIRRARRAALGASSGRLRPLPMVEPRAASRMCIGSSPRLVAQVAFSNWTHDHLLRHPSFQGLREDKSPRLVHAEKPRKISADKPAGGSRGKAKRGRSAGLVSFDQRVTMSIASVSTRVLVGPPLVIAVFWPSRTTLGVRKNGYRANFAGGNVPPRDPKPKSRTKLVCRMLHHVIKRLYASGLVDFCRGNSKPAREHVKRQLMRVGSGLPALVRPSPIRCTDRSCVMCSRLAHQH